MKLARTLPLLALTACLAAPAPVLAQDAGAAPADAGQAAGTSSAAARSTGLSGEKLDNATAEVAAQLRCPVCRGQSVLESTATLSKEMQAEIRRRLAEGQSPEQVRAYFVSRYGEWILLKPPAHGLTILVYLFPAAVLVVGFGLAVLYVKRRAAGSDEDAETAAPAPGAGTGAGTGPGEAPMSAELSRDEEAWLERALQERRDEGA
ncbi:MAG TPA: cytochrome c-type biogenesis protein [Gemmatimonadota bacterium]|nr:cytochrome c-type biogenesis protein [Gemmatimonadota bacterium]